MLSVDEQVAECRRVIGVNKTYLKNARITPKMNEVTRAFVEVCTKGSRDKISKLYRKIDRLTSKPKKGWITPEMVQSAKEHPMSDIVDLNNRRCKAFCHESDSDSMMLTKHNTMKCFVCNKSFDTIGVLMERDGMSFIDAVKYLS